MLSDMFSTASELAELLPPGKRMLIGGLMVHAHAKKAGLPYERGTDDTDVVVEVTVGSDYFQALRAVRNLGFEPYDSPDVTSPAHRFNRGREHIDLMIPDRIRGVRSRGRNVLAAPGAFSALKRPEMFETDSGARIRIPDLPAALSVKGEAAQTSSANAIRHVQDAVLLFACSANREFEPPSKSMRTNINRLLGRLDRSEAWNYADPRMTRLAILGIRQNFRPDWVPPAFVQNEYQPF